MQFNASMFHELRMVIQHASKLFQRAKGPSQDASVLLCVTCLRERNFRATKAITVTRGNAVCLQHFS